MPDLTADMDGLLLLYTLTLAAFEGRNLDLAAPRYRAAHTDPADFAAVAKAFAAFDGDLDPIAAARQLAARAGPAAVEAVAIAAFDAYVDSTRTSQSADGCGTSLAGTNG